METGTQQARDGLDFIVEHSEYVRKLASALDAGGPEAVKVRKQMFELLAALCAHNEAGRVRALETLDHYRKMKGERYKLSFVVRELEEATAIDYQTALVAFINCLIISTPKIVDRIRLRNELVGCRLLPVLNNLRKYAEAEPDIAIQLDVFDEQQESDEAQYLQGSHGVDLNSPLDVFYAILKQVADTPQEIPFLSILQHLLGIDPKEPMSDIIWDTAEKLVHKATLLEKRDDIPRLLRTSSVQNKLLCHCPQKNDINNCGIKRQSSQSSLPPLSPTGVLPPPPPPPPPMKEMVMPPPPPPPPNVSTSSHIRPPPPPLQPSNFLEKRVVPSPPSQDEQMTSKLPQQEIPVPKTKMKTINWNKIPCNKVIGKNNIWTQVAGRHEHSPLADMDWSEMEGLFCQQAISSDHSSSNPVNSTMVPKRIQKEIQEIALLDGKRSLNVNIFLKQFRRSNEDIIQLIKNGAYDEIGTEKLKGLLKILPEVDELDMLKSFDGDFRKLGNAEQFLIKLTALPNYKLRIESMLLKDEFSSNVSYLETSINSMIVAAQDLMTNKPLQEVLYMVLMAGNFLNFGGYAGDAAGIKLSSLQKITDIRANKPNMSLIHFVALQAEKKNKILLSFTENIHVLEDAAKTTIEQLSNEITALDIEIKKVKKQVDLPTTETEIKEQVSDFLMMAENKVSNLQTELKKLDKVRKQLADFFCEDLNSFKIEECFKIFHGFTCKFKQAAAENERRRIQEEQAMARKRQRAELLATKRRQMEYLGASEENPYIDLQIYDPKAWNSKKSRKPFYGGGNSEDEKSLTSSPSFSRKSSFNGSGAEYGTGRDDRSPDITPDGSIRRRRSRVLSEEDDGNLLDFLKVSGDNNRDRKSWGSLDRSWARKARGNSQRKRPTLLGTDVFLERERTSSPTPLAENNPVHSAPEAESNSGEWKQKIENWLQDSEHTQTRDKQKNQSRKLNNRKSNEIDLESDGTSGLDTLPEGKQFYSQGQSNYRRDYPLWKPSATLNNMDIVGVIETVEDIQPRVKDKSAWRKSTLNMPNSTETTTNNISEVSNTMQDTNDRRKLIGSLAEEPAMDKLRIYIRKPSEPKEDSILLDPIRGQNIDEAQDETKENIPVCSNNKVEIDQDNIETPPATRKFFISPTTKREPVQPSPCKRVLGKTFNNDDDINGALMGDGQFNRHSASRRTRRYKRNMDNSDNTVPDILPELNLHSALTTDQTKPTEIKADKTFNNKDQTQENQNKLQKRLRNQTGISNADLKLALKMSSNNNRGVLRDFISPPCIKMESDSVSDPLGQDEDKNKSGDLKRTLSQHSLESTENSNTISSNMDINLLETPNYSPNSIYPSNGQSVPKTTITNLYHSTNERHKLPKAIKPKQILPIDKTEDMAKKSYLLRLSNDLKKNNLKSPTSRNLQKSSSRNSIHISPSSSTSSMKTVRRLPVKTTNTKTFSSKEIPTTLHSTLNNSLSNSMDRPALKRKTSTSSSTSSSRPHAMSFMKPTTSSRTKQSTLPVKKYSLDRTKN